jgi:hypothetical protein
MAKAITHIRVQAIQSDPASATPTDLKTDEVWAEYLVGDEGLSASKRLKLSDITDTDTIADWWASVVAAIESEEGIS